MLKQEWYVNTDAQAALKYVQIRSLEIYELTAHRTEQDLGLIRLCTPARAAFMSSPQGSTLRRAPCLV